MNKFIFRGKRKSDGVFIEGDLVHDVVNAHSRIIKVGIQKPGYYPEEVDENTIGIKFSGINSVFEGDIVRCRIISKSHPSGFNHDKPKSTYKNYLVEYRTKGNTIGWTIRNKRNLIKLSGPTLGNMFYEVIGNIYDNPELLELKEEVKEEYLYSHDDELIDEESEGF